MTIFRKSIKFPCEPTTTSNYVCELNESDYIPIAYSHFQYVIDIFDEKWIGSSMMLKISLNWLT